MCRWNTLGIMASSIFVICKTHILLRISLFAWSRARKQFFVLEQKLGGKIVQISHDSYLELNLLVLKHKPSIAKMKLVTHGGHNILYSPFVKLGNVHNDWNLFKNIFGYLHHQIKNTAKLLWDDEKSIPFIKPMYMVS